MRDGEILNSEILRKRLKLTLMINTKTAPLSALAAESPRYFRPTQILAKLYLQKLTLGYE